MTEATITLAQCTPMNRITGYEVTAAATELTRDWTFAVNGEVSNPTWFDNGLAALNADGSIDVDGVAMAYDATLVLVSTGQVLAQVTKFSWYTDLTDRPIQSMGMFRRKHRPSAADMYLTLTEYVVSDPVLLGLIMPPYLRISPRDSQGNSLCPVELDFIVNIYDSTCVQPENEGTS